MIENQFQSRYDSSLNDYKFPCYTIKRKFNTIKCLRCNYNGHIGKYYHTMRCYACDGFGHKAEYFLRTVKHPERSVLYNVNSKTWIKRKTILLVIK